MLGTEYLQSFVFSEKSVGKLKFKYPPAGILFENLIANVYVLLIFDVWLLSDVSPVAVEYNDPLVGVYEVPLLP